MVVCDTSLSVISAINIEFHLTHHDPDDLDLEALSALFRAVPSANKDDMRQTRIPGLRCARTFVDKSAIDGGGLGLFASRDIAEDELITLYPGDVLLCWPPQEDSGSEDGEEKGATGEGAVKVLLGAGTSASFVSSPFDFGSGAWRYGVHTSATRAICGDPSQDADPAYAGHFANDFATCCRAGTDAERYVARSESAANAALDLWSVAHCHLALVACRPIKMGEEVFMSCKSLQAARNPRIEAIRMVSSNPHAHVLPRHILPLYTLRLCHVCDPPSHLVALESRSRVRRSRLLVGEAALAAAAVEFPRW